MGCLALIFGLACTWGSYELYHMMRESMAFGAHWWLYAILSLMAAFVGGIFLRAAAED